MARPIIVLTNDDGILAPGLEILERTLEEIADIYVVAPAGEMSASSHSLTLHSPLRVDFVTPKKFAVYGTPADCISFAVRELLDDVPDLVISGINQGPNLGEDVIYSGTVAGAREGALFGITSLAISLAHSRGEILLPEDFAQASRISSEIIRSILRNNYLYKDVFLNLNVPVVRDGTPKGTRVTHLASRKYLGRFSIQKEEGISKYYWISGNEDPVWAAESASDYAAVREGYASVTPLELEHTAHERIDEFKFLES